MAAAIPAVLGGVLGGLSKSGQQGGGTKNTSSLEEMFSEMFKSGQSRQSQDTRGETSGFNKAIEDPAATAFRQSLFPMFGQELKRAGEPVFGDAQKASQLNSLNDLAEASMSKLKSSLASTGTLDSGQLSQGISDIESRKNASAAGFFSQIPLMNRQYADQQRGNLLGLASQFAGHGPISSVTGGTTSSQALGESNYTEQGTQHQKGTKSSQEISTVSGAPWWKSILGSIAGPVAGGLDKLGQKKGWWEKP